MESLFRNSRLYRTILDNLSEGVYFTDTDRHIRYWNKGAERITGFSAAEVQGCCCADNILMHTDLTGKSLCRGFCPLAATMQDGQPRSAKLFLHHKEGHRVPVFTTTAAVYDDAGNVVGGLETFHDVTMEIAALAQVEQLRAHSLICPLTGVGNRRYTEQMLAIKFEEMKKNASTVGIVFVDIDNFKSINDTGGHPVGDVVLKMVARTLVNTLRTYDFLGRWGGEEFVAILPNLRKPQLALFAERMRALVEKSSATVSDHALLVTVSVGALVATPADEIDMTVARAGALMLQSKQNGRNRVTLG